MALEIRLPDRRLTAAVAAFGTTFEPTVVGFINTTVEISVMKRRAFIRKSGIERHWAGTGVYLLLGPAADGKSVVRARPGSAGDLIRRIHQHYIDPTKSWFNRVVLIQDTRQGFNSAEYGFIEGRLHDLCREAADVEHIFKRDTDDTLQKHEEAEFERRYIPQICSLLELIGVPLETAAEAAKEDAKPYQRRPTAWAKAASVEADREESGTSSAQEGTREATS